MSGVGIDSIATALCEGARAGSFALPSYTITGDTTTNTQGTTCSSFYSACYDKSVQGMSPAKAKADCNEAIGQCKWTGCFVGPHSGVTFACNLVKS